MAFVDIPEEPMKQFVDVPKTFKKVGDSFGGVFVSDGENPNGYGQDYLFKVGECDAACFTLKGALNAQLQKAKRDGLLKPGALVAIQLRELRDVGKESPMKCFKVRVDPDYKGANPKPTANFKLKERKQASQDFDGGFDASGDEAPF